MSDNLRQQLDLLPGLLGAHVTLTLIALGLGILLSLPTAIAVAKSPRWRFPVLTAAGVVQTIPGLALLALMVPLLGAFGFWPALTALVLYSVLPIVRNTVTGILGVDAAVTEAAVGVGMTPVQVLTKVELPLALPVIVAGMRTAAVWVVGIATLSTPVGQPSLGNYIFAGLQTRNWTSVLVGCAASAALAVTLDALLGAIERGMSARRPATTRAAAVALFLVLGAGVSSPLLSRGGPSPSSSSEPLAHATSATVAPGDAGPAGSAATSEPDRPALRLIVGSKTFTEQYVLASLVAARLERAGIQVERADSLGSTVAFDALANGDIDVYVDYTGTIWANYMKREGTASAWRVSAGTAAWLAREHGIRQLGELGFENAYALAMRSDRARSLGVRSIRDLARRAPELSLGSDYEFFQRPEWRGVRDAYGLEFAELESFDSTFMYPAVRDGEVDVITAFSSDGRIAAFDLAVLDDPEQAFPPYDAVLLMSPRAAASRRAVEALTPLIGSISVSLMRKANLMVDREGSDQTPRQAAAWLDGKIASTN